MSQTIEQMEQALSSDPLDRVTCRRLADAYAVRGRLKDTVSTYLRLTEMLKQSGDQQSALQMSDMVLRIQPDSVEARLHRIAIFENSRPLPGDLVHSYRDLARLYVELGRGEEAIALLERAQRSIPENLDIGLELAEINIGQGHMREGLQNFSRVAQAHLDMGQREKACEAFRRMKVVSPSDSLLLITLARLYLDLGRLGEAEQELRALLRLNLNNEEALLSLGEVCQIKGQYRDAVLAFNRLLSLDPDNLVVREKLGQLYQFQGITQDAVLHYLAAAEGHLKRGEKLEAVRLFRTVLGLDASHSTAIRELTNLEAPLWPLLVELPTVEVKAEPEPVVVVTDSGRLKPLKRRETPEELHKRSLFKPLLGSLQGPALKASPAKPLLCRPQQPETPTPEICEEPIFCQSLPPLGVDWLSPEFDGLTGSSDWLEEDLLPETQVRCQQAIWSPLSWPMASAAVLPATQGWTTSMIAERPRANLSLEDLASPEELALTRRVRDEVSLLDTPAQIRAYAQAIEEYPDVLLLRVQAAQLHLNAGLCDQAVAILAQALSRFPEVTGLHHHYIQALIWNDDYNQAGQACLQLADLYLAQKNVDGSMDAVQLLLSLDPTHVEARKRLVFHLQEQGQEQMSLLQLSQLAEQAGAQGLWAEALQAWQRLYDCQQNPLALERLGYLCQRLGRTGEAQRHYQQLLDYFEEQKRTLDAVSICDRLIELQPEDLELQHRQLCLLHSVLDLNPLHEGSLQKVVDIQLACAAYSEAVVSGERLAQLYLEQYNLSGAIAVHLQLLGCLPENVGLRHNLAGLYQLDNQFEQAVAQLEILGQLLEAGPALDCLRQAYALQPGYPGLAESLLRALMDQAKVEEAAALLRAHPHLTSTLCQSTQDPFCLGQLYYHLGQLDSAIERFQSTRRVPDYMARSYAMLGLCFAAKDGCNMLDLGIRQLCKGLDLPGLNATERQELQTTLDQLQRRRALS